MGLRPTKSMGKLRFIGKKLNNEWQIFTLNGIQSLNLSEPVLHISYYEADAFACWKNCRLPTEAEWEHYVNLIPHLQNMEIY